MSQLAPMETVTSRDGTPIAFQRSGLGSPLVLVHGASSDHTRWAPVLPYLEPHFTMYAVDRRGRGRSGDTAPYSVEREFEDLAAVIDAIGGQVDLLGHSYGGLCAVGAALRTSHLRRLIVYEPPLTTRVESRHPPEVLAKLKTLLADGDREGAVIVFAREIVRMSEAELAQLRSDPAAWASRQAAVHTVVRELQVTEGSYVFDTQRLKVLTLPTLLLIGSDSPSALHAGTNILKAALPNSRVVAMPGQQHLAMNLAPEMFAREVIAFLTGD